MKITGCEVRYVRAEAQSVRFSHMTIPERAGYFLRIFTDAGIEGFGEIDAPTTGLPGTIEMLEGRFLPALLGEDPRLIGGVWEKLFALIKPMGRLQSTEMYVLGAVDIALWDILGKSASQPVARLLGQVKQSIPAYASLGYVPPEELRAAIERCKKSGFTAVKIRIGFEPEEDLALVRIAKEAAGDAVQVMVDVNSGWTPTHALRSARQLEPFSLAWIEEPLEPYLLDASADLAASLDTPIALGEHEIFNLYDAARIIRLKAADIIQPDLRAGGLSECRRMAAVASASGIPCIPHFYGNGVRFAALAHFAAATVNCPWIETDVHDNPLRTKIFGSSLEPRGGVVTVSDKPGLGLDVDLEALYELTFASAHCGDAPRPAA